MGETSASTASPLTAGFPVQAEVGEGGTEAWPSLQVAKELSACLFLDDAGDIYDPRYWDDIVRLHSARGEMLGQVRCDQFVFQTCR
jgi:hypothetical protein